MDFECDLKKRESVSRTYQRTRYKTLIQEARNTLCVAIFFVVIVIGRMSVVHLAGHWHKRHATGISLARRDPLRGLYDRRDEGNHVKLSEPQLSRILSIYYLCSLIDYKTSLTLLLVKMRDYSATFDQLLSACCP